MAMPYPRPATPRPLSPEASRPMMSRVVLFFLLLLLGVSAFASFRLLEASLAAEVYRGRLAELAADYESLLGQYNEAVRRTAVTELRVEDGALTVVIRTAEGDLKI